MNEEEAVFRLGKELSKLRNDGHDLPTDPVAVGDSMVPPVELADEYDRHFPPGPRKVRQDTDRVFEYERHYLYEYRMGAPVFGLSIRFGDREFTVLKDCELFRCISPDEFKTRIKTSKTNRFDVIRGDNWTFVIDKINETISVAHANYRIDGSSFCNETPITGLEVAYIEEKHHSPLASTHFPFVPFDRFWDFWKGYVAFRKSQIEEAREMFRSLRVPVKGDEVSVLHAHPEYNLTDGALGTVVDVLEGDTYLVRFGEKTAIFPGTELRIHSYSDATNRD